MLEPSGEEHGGASDKEIFETALNEIAELYFPGIHLQAFHTEFSLHHTVDFPINNYAALLTTHIQNTYKPPKTPWLNWFSSTTDVLAKTFTPSINRYTTAFAILQNTGFALQNESTYLSLIDMYNAWRLTYLLSDARSTRDQVSILFLPLYDEYHLIMRSHSHPLVFLFRVLMPLIVLCLFVGAIGLLCSSLPELVFLVILIPTIIVGTLFAAQYIALKNMAYNHCREWWYGGRYQTPEFTELNRRTAAVFNNNQTLAEQVRDYYVNELLLCEEKERGFVAMASKQLEIFDGYPQQVMFNNSARETNAERRITLWGEWLLIREGTRTDANGAEAKKLLVNRIKKDIDAHYAGLKNITFYAQGAQTELIRAIDDPNYTPRLFGNPCPFNQDESLNKAIALKTSLEIPAR